MAEGIFNCHDPNIPHSGKEFAMHHSMAMAQQLLMWVEQLKLEGLKKEGVFENKRNENTKSPESNHKVMTI